MNAVLTGLALAVRAYRRRNRTPLVQRVAAARPTICRRTPVVIGLAILPVCFVVDLVRAGYCEVRKNYEGVWSDTIVPTWSGRYL